MTTRERIGFTIIGGMCLFVLAIGAFVSSAPCQATTTTIVVTATPMPTHEGNAPNAIMGPVAVDPTYLASQPNSCLATVSDTWHPLLNENGETTWYVPRGTQVAVDLLGPLYQGGAQVLHVVVFNKMNSGTIVRTGGWAFSKGLALDPACAKLAN